MNKTPIGIIDDHKLFRSGIADIIEDTDQFAVVVSASNSDELYEQLSSTEIEILLLDIKLKEENGLDILTHLRATKPLLKVVMLTMHNEASYINTMVQKGANGYLMKDTTPEELIYTLQRVHADGKYYDSAVTNVIIEAMQTKEKLSSIGIELSETDHTIIRYISEGKTAVEIGNLIFKSTRTVEGYRTKLLEKTGTKNVAELVSWGYQNGVL